MDKERLYDENLALKSKVNSLSEDNILLRTRISQLERDLCKKELLSDPKTPTDKSGSKNLHFITNLKQTVKELRTLIQNRDSELSSLKKTTKNTKVIELEAENQALVDECTRLRHHLEEILKQQGIGINDLSEMQEEHYQKTLMFSNIQKQNADLSYSLAEAKDEIKRLRDKASDTDKNKKKRLSPKKSEINALKAEIQNLRQQAEKESRDSLTKELEFKSDIDKLKKMNQEYHYRMQTYEVKIKDQMVHIEQYKAQNLILQNEIEDSNEHKRQAQDGPLDMSNRRVENPPKLFKMIYNLINKKRMLLVVFLSLLDRNNNGYVETNEFIARMKAHGQKVKRKHVVEVIELVTGQNTSLLHLRSIEKVFEQYQYSLSPLSESSDEEIISKKHQKAGNLDEIKPVDVLELKTKISEAKQPIAELNKFEKREFMQQYGRAIKETVKEEILNEGSIKTIDHSLKDIIVVQQESEQTLQRVLQNSITQLPIETQHSNQQLLTKTSSPIPHLHVETQASTINKVDHSIIKSSDSNSTIKSINQSITVDEKSSTREKSLDKLIDPELPTIKTQEIIHIYKHIALQMQLNRNPKSELMTILFGASLDNRSLTKQDIIDVFSRDPLTIANDPKFEKFCQYLVEPSQDHIKQSEFQDLKSLISEIGKKIHKDLADWPVYTKENEEYFDERISGIINANLDTLMDSCIKLDSENSGAITIADFSRVLIANSIEIDSDVLDYMKLLFYSSNLKLDEVPYRKFLDAYKEKDEDEYEEDYEGGDTERNDEERARIMRHIFEMISNSMKNKHLNVQDVFQYSRKGLITLENFTRALQRLELESIDKDFILIIFQSLQYEEAAETCIHVDDLEEIMEHYGITLDNIQKIDEKNEFSTEENKSEDSSMREMIETLSKSSLKQISIAKEASEKVSDAESYGFIETDRKIEYEIESDKSRDLEESAVNLSKPEIDSNPEYSEEEYENYSECDSSET